MWRCFGAGGWKSKVLQSWFLVPFVHREGAQAQSAPLLISLFIFLWALFDSFFPTLCLFSDPKICLGRRFLHPVGSASSTCAWTPFLTNSASLSENPPLITLVPGLAFHCLKNACEFFPKQLAVQVSGDSSSWYNPHKGMKKGEKGTKSSCVSPVTQALLRFSRSAK